MSLSCLQTDVDHLSSDSHIQWAINQQMFSHQHRLPTVTVPLQWKLHSMFLNWNARGSVSTHKRTEVTLNQTWKLTEIEPRAWTSFWHVVLLACLFLTVDYKHLGSIHSPTDGARSRLQSTMKGCSPWSSESTWHLPGPQCFCSLEVWLLVRGMRAWIYF